MNMFNLGKYNGIIWSTACFMLFVATLLAYNYFNASRFAADALAVRQTALQQAHPKIVAHAAANVAIGLEKLQDVSQPLEDLRQAARSYDETLAALTAGRAIRNAEGESVYLSISAASGNAILVEAGKLWAEYKTKIDPVARFSGSPYDQNDAGQGLSRRGETLKEQIAELLEISPKIQPQLTKLTAAISLALQSASSERAKTMSFVQAAGIALAIVILVAMFTVFLRNLQKEEAQAERARKETQDIMRTVNEGLFLLDSDRKIGSERSMAMNDIFRRQDFTGLAFEDLLRNIVPEKTLKTAQDYVKLLWGDRVNEKLVKSINPLNEVEVHFENPAGGFDTHFLEFDFNRVKTHGAMSHLLVTVNDVTKRVLLAHELQESQEKAQQQLDMLLRILHVEPDSLTSFLADAEVSLKMVNSILKEPAREESAFRAKIDNMYRQVHSVKGEAAALGLKTVEQRAHAFEGAINELKSRANLSGSDFLPLVVKLDDLFSHLSQVREMLGRLVDLHQAIANRHVPRTSESNKEATAREKDKMSKWLTGQSDASPIEPTAATLNDESGAHKATPLETTLDELTKKVAATQNKRVKLQLQGLDRVPEFYKRAVKDITIQLVRNAVVHGIESPQDRLASQKGETGTLAIDFIDRGSEGYELVARDDGRGIQVDRIKEVAVERGLVTEEQARTLDARQAMALIFRPGFTTSSEVTTDAGRGAGMDLVRALVAELGGRVGVSSAGGRFSKFKIWLPSLPEAAAA